PQPPAAGRCRVSGGGVQGAAVAADGGVEVGLGDAEAGGGVLAAHAVLLDEFEAVFGELHVPGCGGVRVERGVVDAVDVVPVGGVLPAAGGGDAAGAGGGAVVVG